MNPHIKELREYPFARLNRLYETVTPPSNMPAIKMHIGEPQHALPDYVTGLLGQGEGLAAYPPSNGLPALRASCADALQRRFHLPTGFIDPETMVVPVNGTREGLFSFVQAMVGSKSSPVVVMPNPFYQIYEGATLLAGAEPYFANCSEATGFLPDLAAVPDSIWTRTEVLFLCSPGNPQGQVASKSYLRTALKLADQFEFIIAADECYADIYRQGNPPVGLLDVCYEDGRNNLDRCALFHSLSKRSNAPGLRSGCVIASAQIVDAYRLYRTYHGCAMPTPTQRASIALWNDDDTPAANRQLYDEKFTAAAKCLQAVWPQHVPPGAFYLWSKTPYDDERFARDLYAQQNVTVLPGTYLARDAHGANPGRGWVRISLVPLLEQCEEAAQRMVKFITAGNH